MGAPTLDGETGVLMVFEGGRALTGLTRYDADVVVLLGDVPLTRTGKAFAVCDLDADGTNELIVAGGYGGVIGKVSEGGRWQYQTTLEGISWESNATAMACADLDGDGQPDLAVSDAEEGVTVLPGGAWLQGVTTVDLLDTPSALRIAPPFPPGEGERLMFADQFAVGDFDGDGIRDLAVGYPMWDFPDFEVGDLDRIDIYVGGTAFPDEVVSIPCPALTSQSCGDLVSVADLDRDGAHELVAADLYGVHVLGGATPLGDAAWSSYVIYEDGVFVQGVTGAATLTPEPAVFGLTGTASSLDFRDRFAFAFPADGLDAPCTLPLDAGRETGASFVTHPVLGADGRVARWEQLSASVGEDRISLVALSPTSTDCAASSPFTDAVALESAALVDIDGEVGFVGGTYQSGVVTFLSGVTPVSAQARVAGRFR